MPLGVKMFGPRSLLTRRCYSNIARKSGPNITFDLACQLIQHHPFWNRLPSLKNYRLFPPHPSIHFVQLPLFSSEGPAVNEYWWHSCWKYVALGSKRSKGSHQGQGLSLCLFSPKALWWIGSPRKQKLSTKTSNCALYISAYTHWNPACWKLTF